MEKKQGTGINWCAIKEEVESSDREVLENPISSGDYYFDFVKKATIGSLDELLPSKTCPKEDDIVSDEDKRWMEMASGEAGSKELDIEIEDCDLIAAEYIDSKEDARRRQAYYGNQPGWQELKEDDW